MRKHSVLIALTVSLLSQSSWGGYNGPSISQGGSYNPGSEVIGTERVKVSDPSQGYDASGQPKQSDATRVYTQDGRQITITDDGRQK